MINDLEDIININSTIRYNQETDMIQLLGTDGVWYDFTSGKLGTKYIIKNGFLQGTYSVKAGAVSVENNSDGVYCLIAGANNNIENLITFSEGMDIVNYQRLCIEYLTSGTGNDVDYRIGFANTVNPSKYTDITKYVSANTSLTSVNIIKNPDSVCVALAMYSSRKYYIKNMWFE